MKLFAKLLITILVIGGLLPFTLIKGRDGKPLMSFSNIKLPDFSVPDLGSVPEVTPVKSTSVGNKGKDIFYKWLDADGNLQFTTQPPPQGREFTIKRFDPDTNLIQAIKPGVGVVESGKSFDPDAGKVTSVKDIGNPYSPGKIKKLFDDANNVEKLLKQRLDQQQSVINQ